MQHSFLKYSLTPALFMICISVAKADIPVIDNSNLNEHSKTQSHTNTTKDTQTSTTGNTKGIDCSVHQGSKNGDAKDGASGADKSSADGTVKTYGGDPMQNGGASASAEGVARDQTGQVIGQQNATSQDVKSASTALEELAKKIGSSDTIRGAYDQNSVIAAQNGMQLNGVIRIANAWVQAVNLTNLMNGGQQSAAATITTPPSAPSCVAGTIGQGTDARPCASKACETVQLSEQADPGCMSVRYHDSYNHVITYLLTVEDAVNFKTQGIVFN